MSPDVRAAVDSAPRPVRYALVSVLAGLVAQAGLLLAYAGFGWGTTPAVLFSLAVSVGPSYLGCRLVVWAGLSRHRLRAETTSFALVALAGSATATVLTRLAEAGGRAFTDDRVLLGLWVSAGALGATALVWVARYVVLDRLVFPGERPTTEPRVSPDNAARRLRVAAPTFEAAPERDAVSGSTDVGSSPGASLHSAHPSRGPDVSVVLPCLDEAASVGLCVTEALEALIGAGLAAEVIVVDNGCADDSAAVAAMAGARVVAEPTPGYGAAVRAGIAAAEGRVVVMADADCTYPLDRIAELVEPVMSGEVGLCLGSRLGEATMSTMPFLHRFVGTPALTLLVRQGGGYANLTDSQSGFRAFGREEIRRLGLRSTGMEFASEMLLRASQSGMSVREVPLGYRARVGESKLSTWTDGMRHLRLIMRLSPYQLLWSPGLVALALSVLLYGAGIASRGELTLGPITWQPIFLGSILMVLGATATLAAGVVGYHLPGSASNVRHRYRWVGHVRFPRWVATVGLGAAALGVALEMMLLVAWLQGTEERALRIAIAGTAQGLIITGIMLAVFALLYRLLIDLAASPTLPGAKAVGNDRRHSVSAASPAAITAHPETPDAVPSIGRG